MQRILYTQYSHQKFKCL